MRYKTIRKWSEVNSFKPFRLDSKGVDGYKFVTVLRNLQNNYTLTICTADFCNPLKSEVSAVKLII